MNFQTDLIYLCGNCSFRTRSSDRADRHRSTTRHWMRVEAARRTELVSVEDFTQALRERLPKTHGGRTVFAAELGVSTQFLSRVLAGQAKPGPAIAKAMGYKQVVAFVELPAAIIEGKLGKKR
jgi:hypothetical protein